MILGRAQASTGEHRQAKSITAKHRKAQASTGKHKIKESESTPVVDAVGGEDMFLGELQWHDQYDLRMNAVWSSRWSVTLPPCCVLLSWCCGVSGVAAVAQGHTFSGPLADRNRTLWNRTPHRCACDLTVGHAVKQHYRERV
jgi:hypothetical protein